MSKPEFVHLHAHSDYSLLDGCARFSNEKGEPTPMVAKLASWGFKHQALTDHGNIFGAIEFYQACQSAGINPIIGCEIYVARGSRFDRKTPTKDDENPQKTGINHLTILARNNEGYQNLIELTTKASLEGFYYKPRADKELLRTHSGGLTALSGCLKGEVAQSILAGNTPQATERVKELEEIFGKGNFFLEVMDHGLEAQKKVGQAILEISQKTGIPIVATNDCHYFLKEEAAAHDALLCIGTGKKLEDQNRMRYASQEFYYKRPEEMEKLFSLYPDAMKNTLRIAESCKITISFNELHLPDYQTPEGFSQESLLESLCEEGLLKKFPAGAAAVYRQRLMYELSVIKKMGFQGYFLIVWDFINFARKNHVPVGPGRGSGAGSLVSYLLNITSVDPIVHGLLFERFLNPNRRSMPDLDIDFSDEGRELVINYVREKYGFVNVAPIITFGSMQSRLVVRDVGRVMGVPLAEVDKIAKAIPPGMNIDSAVAKSRELGLMYEENETVKKILNLATKLEGCRRHTGIHAAGIVITKEPVTKYAPQYKNPTSGVVSTGFNDESLVRLGLLKVDFLGLRTLTVIKNAIDLIESHQGLKLDIEKIPYDDKKTFDLLGRAQAGGVFQLESRGMRDLLIKLKPAKLDEIIALIALFRPGPMKWIDEYVARKHNTSRVRYEHPRLEPILKETYGICLYQEQVMEIAKQLAGFPAGDADKLRKAMGKKIPAELDKLEEQFIDGCRKNSIDPKFAEKLYEDLKDFGHYAFNKSHSAAYGIVAYQTAYLKANFPIEFMAALSSSEIGRTAVGSEDKENKVATYLAEAKSMGFEPLPPSVNHSQKKFTIENNKIRFGLLAIKNIGEGAVEEIINKRTTGGPFKTLKDFFERVAHHTANKKVLEALTMSGALDSILEGDSALQKRAAFLDTLDVHLKFWGAALGDTLFDMEPTAAPVKKEPPPKETMLQWEKESLGIYLSEHPLNRWRAVLESLPITSLKEPQKVPAGQTRWIAGIVINIRKQVAKKSGQAWAKIKLEDLTGEVDAILFPRAFAQTKPEALKAGAILMALGKPSLRADVSDGEGQGFENEFYVDCLMTLDEFLSEQAMRLEMNISGTKASGGSDVKELLLKQAGGKTAICLRLGNHVINLPQKITLHKELCLEISQLSNSMIIAASERSYSNGKRA